MKANKLPGINCGQCGYETCDDFKESGKSYTYCIALKTDKTYLKKKGLIDGLEYDFKLEPLDGETSCREFLLSLTPAKLKVGDCISYRPLGCPIPHFAKVVGLVDGMIEVLIIGPVKARALGPVKRLGICMVLGFIGLVDGDIPKVGQTVVFMPSKCSMGKCHSGIVVSVESKEVRIEIIDLKVWKK
jgi:hypothetical protein